MAEQDWRRNVLLAIGAPASRANIAFLTGWARVEGTKARYNPLATTLALPGSTTLAGNPDGVREYRSFQQGVTATANTIRKYPAIVEGLRKNNPDAYARVVPAKGYSLFQWAPRDAGYVDKVLDAFADALNKPYEGSSPFGNLPGRIGGAIGDGASSAASAVADATGVTAAIDAGRGVIDAGQAVAGGVQTVVSALFNPSTWYRVGLILGGGLLIGGGLLLLARSVGAPSNVSNAIAPEGSVAGTIADVMPQARAMRMAAKAGPARSANLRKTTKVRPLDDPAPRRRSSSPSAQNRDGVPF